mgnify:FL=1|jgi:glycosyltransferase involved in cell wall biosynthesis
MTKSILVRGPALSQTGYGEQSRFALRSLLTRPDLFDVYLHPTNWGKSSWLMPNDPDRDWIDQLIRKTISATQSGIQFDASLQITIPNEWEKLAPINIGYTAGIETTRIAPQWIEKCALMDKIVTISNFSREVIVNTVFKAKNTETEEIVDVSVQTPVGVAHYPVRSCTAVDINLNLEYDFNFLVVAQWGIRKNLENTVRWWIEEFKDDEVGLVVKTNIMKNCHVDKLLTQDKLNEILRDYPDRKCKVHLLHGYMTLEEMNGLYQNSKIKCMVSLAHGEGFGLPIFEAAYNGVLVVAPNWSGHLDFLVAPRKVKRKGKSVKKTLPCFLPVDYDLSPIQPEAVWGGVLDENAMWSYAKEVSYKKKIRDAVVNYRRHVKMANALQKHIKENFSEDGMYKNFVDLVSTEFSFTSDQREIDDMFASLMSGE